MIRHHVLEPRFVVSIPKDLDPGVLYVSMEYGTVVHSCCCGCGQEVVTPLTPTDWHLGYDGEGVTLRPSVGNWNLPCQSHYVITRNRVIESGRWSQARIEAERRRDRQAKADYYRSKAEGGAKGPSVDGMAPVAENNQPSPAESASVPKGTWLSRWWRRTSGR